MSLEESKSPNGGNRQGFKSANQTTTKGKPMTSLALNTNFVKTMSSREIAELTGKEHRNVKRDCEVMFSELNLDALSFEHIYLDSMNRQQTEYLLTFELVQTLITGYSIKLRFAVIQRLNELEAQVSQPALALPNFTDPAEAAIAWAAEFKAKQLAQVQVVQLEAENQSMKTDVKALEQIAKSDGSFCLLDTAKTLQVKPKVFMNWMQSHSWIYKRAGCAHWVGYQDKIQSGHLEHKTTTVTRGDGSEKIVEQVRVTAKGLTRLAKIFAKGEAA